MPFSCVGNTFQPLAWLVLGLCAFTHETWVVSANTIGIEVKRNLTSCCAVVVSVSAFFAFCAGFQYDSSCSIAGSLVVVEGSGSNAEDRRLCVCLDGGPGTTLVSERAFVCKHTFSRSMDAFESLRESFGHLFGVCYWLLAKRNSPSCANVKRPPMQFNSKRSRLNSLVQTQ